MVTGVSGGLSMGRLIFGRFIADITITTRAEAIIEIINVSNTPSIRKV
jgi:hypothetical protein